jgi:hypothetical protein
MPAAAQGGGLPPGAAGLAEEGNWPAPWRGQPPTPGAPVAGAGEGCSVSDLLVPSCGAWTGVAPGAFTEQPKREALADFERRTGEPVDIVHVYHRAGTLFPTARDLGLARQGGTRRLLLVNYKPEGGHTWAEVADGAMDEELDRQAAYLRAHYTDPFFLAVHHEPENEVVPDAGSGFTARDYARMYRHVIQRLRGQGVDNIVSVFNLMGTTHWATRPWFEQLYPGDSVVDWIAWDPYACGDPDLPCGDFAGFVNRTADEWPGFYAWATATHPDKPLMIAEWGVAEHGDPDRKADFFATVAEQLPEFPAIKALVYFDSPRAHDGDTRVTSTRAALDAYRELIRSPIFRQRVG